MKGETVYIKFVDGNMKESAVKIKVTEETDLYYKGFEKIKGKEVRRIIPKNDILEVKLI